MTSPASEALRLELEIPNEVHVRGVVPILLRVTNTASHTLDLYLRGREPTFDVIASSQDGKIVWRLLENTIVPAILRIESLEPNASLTLHASWALSGESDTPIPPGTYSLVGVLFTDGPELRTPPAVLRVRPPLP